MNEVKECDGLVCILEDKIDAGLVECGKGRLKVVSTMSVGVDHIDLSACGRAGVVVGNTPGCLTDTTADLAVGLMLASMRRFMEGSDAVKNGGWGSWQPDWLCGSDLHGSKVGIVGMGRIGQAVARRCALGFDCEVNWYDPSVNKTQLNWLQKGDSCNSLEDLLKKSDVVSCHCPLTPETKDLFGKDAFKAMQPHSSFINTSRGPVVDQDALFWALKSNQIFSAAIDVTVPEPLPPNHQLLSLPNLLVLPHLGSASNKTRETMGMIAIENLSCGLYGKPLPHSVSTS